MKSIARKIIIFAKLTMVLFLASGINIVRAETVDAHVLVINSYNAAPLRETEEGFKQYLIEQKMGVKFESFQMNGDVTRVVRVVQEAEKKKADLFFTLGTLATETIINKNIKTPIVASLTLKKDTIEKSANATGVVIDFSVKNQLQWIQRFLPKCKTIGILYNPEQNQKIVDTASRIAKQMGLRIDAQKVNAPRELPKALRNLSRSAHIIWGIADRIVLTPQTAKKILLFSFRNRIPFVGLSNNWVKAGALYALTLDYYDLGQQSGEIAFKVLNGSPAKSIPPTRPRKIMYSLNLKTAQHMKIEIPETLIRNANEVF